MCSTKVGQQVHIIWSKSNTQKWKSWDRLKGEMGLRNQYDNLELVDAPNRCNRLAKVYVTNSCHFVGVL